MKKKANKYDNDKLRYDLVPIEAFQEVIKVYTLGAKKYGERNWEKGMNWGRLFAASKRHLDEFWKGNNIDEEMQTYHLANAAWNCLSLLQYLIKEIGIDDRNKI